MQIEMMSPKKLKPFDKNPRDNDEAIEEVAVSIEENGFNQPIVIDQHDVICVGHTRWLAAIKRKWKEVPVYKKEMTKAEFLSYNLADNRTNQNSKWKNDLLTELMEEIQQLDPKKLKATGFTDSEIDALLDTSDIDDLLEEDEAPVGGTNKPVEKSHVKMVQLFLDDVTFPKFIEMAESIREYMTTDNLTDTVYNSVEKVYDEIKNA